MLTPVDMKDNVLPKNSEVHIKFHQQNPRRGDFLYGTQATRRRMVVESVTGGGSGKDHFALGPGQYDLINNRPQTTGAVKFSPSDRFHENYSTDRPGPGQYLTNDELVSPRPVAAVFSQKPRQTNMASVTSPTASVVSSYYYVPKSSFRDGSYDYPDWSRSPRFKTRHRIGLASKKNNKQQSTDFVAKNMQELQKLAAQYRKRHGGGGRNQDDHDLNELAPPPVSFKRRSSILSTASAHRSSLSTPRHPPSFFHGHDKGQGDLVLQSWLTFAWISAVQARMTRIHQLTSLMRQILRSQNHKTKQVIFVEWKKLDATRHRHYAADLINKNTLRWRIWLRIHKKRWHVSILRQFLRGLSFDVRFSIAMKRIKRKIQLIQRWWRHVQLMVRAREEALYHKWITVENRLRLEYISQMPHLQRIFQLPSGTVVANQAAYMGSASGNAADIQLHKLLNLPDQKRWYSAHFVLTSDGGLRGYAAINNEMLVEIKNFRCHFHDVSASSSELDVMNSLSDVTSSLNAYNSYTNAAWKPFLMLFRQGAFRFVLLTSPSPLPTEILNWKDKLERLMVMSTTGNSYNSSFSVSNSDVSFNTSVSDLVAVSMRSGILAPSSQSSLNLHQGSSSSLALVSTSTGATPRSSSSSGSASSPTRGKLQARVRSIRQRTKTGLNVTEGTLSYYVVDLLKDFPKVPSAVVWQTIRDKLREKRKAFRAEIYRYKLELFHYHQHQEQIKQVHVLDKFREFFTLERPRRPHFRSLISNRKMEALIRQTVEQVKQTTPSNPKYLVDATKQN
ncbi:hypothetical protein Poli38472_012936 [Pythium oligandrum]|uniref:Uncharacterized protein n=1 Tax=Pythium oligandrum TaxID=41045 RepID=A0A8K1CIQ7_PYTOL|nr:hypothetical protein Poli38472_012936 [Pythium oligandrum]|eukprot:TMW64314.1 hypothetical protein Poli38472_012936 [Pythium oligandrum]